MAKKDENKKEEPSKEKIMGDIKQFSEEVLKKYGKYIKAIVMMGSVVRDEFKATSDVDVLPLPTTHHLN